MKRFNKIALYGLLALAISGVAFCGDQVPMEELNTAKINLSEAELLKADKNAKTDYQAAQKHMFTAMDNIQGGDYGDAKSNAVKAAELAKKAYDTAGPITTDQQLKEVQDLKAKADKAYAKKLAPEEYQAGNEFLVAGQSAKQQQNWKDAYLKLEQSKESYQKALNICLAQKSQLENMASETENNIALAKKYGAEKYAPQELKSAQKNLAAGKQSLAADDLQNAFPQITTAKADSEAALSKTQKVWAMSKKDAAAKQVALADATLADFKSKYSESIPKYEDVKYDVATQEENLAAAKNALKSSDGYYNGSQYEESYKQSEEAENLAKIVLEQIPVIQNKLIEYINAECPAGMTKDESGKYCVDGQGNKKEIAQDEEPTAGDDQPTTLKPDAPKGWKAYKVVWRKQNTDCLWRIASYPSIYSDAKLWPRIYKANKAKIKNPDLIYPGQVFAVPPKSGDVDALIAEKNAYPQKLKDWYKNQNNQPAPAGKADESLKNPGAPDDYFVPNLDNQNTGKTPAPAPAPNGTADEEE